MGLWTRLVLDLCLFPLMAVPSQSPEESWPTHPSHPASLTPLTLHTFLPISKKGVMMPRIGMLQWTTFSLRRLHSQYSMKSTLVPSCLLWEWHSLWILPYDPGHCLFYDLRCSQVGNTTLRFFFLINNSLDKAAEQVAHQPDTWWGHQLISDLSQPIQTGAPASKLAGPKWVGLLADIFVNSSGRGDLACHLLSSVRGNYSSGHGGEGRGVKTWKKTLTWLAPVLLSLLWLKNSFYC